MENVFSPREFKTDMSIGKIQLSTQGNTTLTQIALKLRIS